jgi:hypothetical protein
MKSGQNSTTEKSVTCDRYSLSEWILHDNFLCFYTHAYGAAIAGSIKGLRRIDDSTVASIIREYCTAVEHCCIRADTRTVLADNRRYWKEAAEHRDIDGKLRLRKEKVIAW